MKRRSNSREPRRSRFVQMNQLWAATCLPAFPFQSAPIRRLRARLHPWTAVALGNRASRRGQIRMAVVTKYQ